MCSDPAELCVSSQQHIKVLLHALAQLSVDFVVAPRPPRGSARAESYPAACTHLWARAVVGRLRAVRDKKNKQQQRRGAVWRWRDTRQRWVRPRWSTFPDWTDRQRREGEEVEEEEKEAKTVAAETAGSSSHAAREDTHNTHTNTHARAHANNSSSLG